MKRRIKESPVQEIDAKRVSFSVSDGIPQPEAFADDIEAYSRHVWVYACANLIANAFSTIDFLPYAKAEDGSWSVAETHPFFKLLQNPNPYMSGIELRRIMSLSSKLTGNAYIVTLPKGDLKKDTARQEVLELWPLPPQFVRPITSSEKFIEGYVYDVLGQKKTFSTNRIIHFRDANPGNLQYGQGSVTAAKNSITSDLMADAWNRYFFANNGRPDAILESDSGITQEEQKRITEGWQKLYAGATKRGKVAVLGGGLKYKESNRAHKDMDFVALRKMLREEILASFGVPQSMVGILDQANYSNMKEQTKVFWNQTMIPEIRKFEAVLTNRAKMLTGIENVIIQADLSKVEALREDENAKATLAKLYVDMGIPLGQVVEALDLPFEVADDEGAGDGEGDDEPKTPAAGAPEAEDDPKEGDEPGEKAVKGLDDPRTVLWKRFDAGLRDHEDGLQLRVRDVFRGQKARVIAAIKARADELFHVKHSGATKAFEDNLLNWDNERKLFAKKVKPGMKNAYLDFAARTARKLGAGADFKLSEAAAENWIEAKVFKLVQGATAYTKEQISDAVREAVEEVVAEGLSAGDAINTVVDKIDDVYRFAMEGRAERIARTEIVSASNAGSVQAAKQLGAEKKEWLTSRDNKVRDLHDGMDGQQVSMESTFEDEEGNKLAFPGDPSAPGGSVINCRCTVVFD